jgi:hypothetical protein
VKWIFESPAAITLFEAFDVAATNAKNRPAMQTPLAAPVSTPSTRAGVGALMAETKIPEKQRSIAKISTRVMAAPIKKQARILAMNGYV